MSPIPDLLKSLSFAATHPVAGRASVADLFKPKGRCGIYVLHFATGERYIGQALDVTRRYVQHCKTHGDIEQLSFKRVARKDLNEAERQTIRLFNLRQMNKGPCVYNRYHCFDLADQALGLS